MSYYFYEVLEQLKTNIYSNFHFKRFLGGFVIEYAFAWRVIYMVVNGAVM